MKLKFVLPLLALTLTAAQAQTVSVYPAVSASNVEAGIMGGYYNGLGGQVFIGVRNLRGPIGARLSASYATNSNGFDGTVPAVYSNTDLLQVNRLSSTGSKSYSTTVGLDATYGLGQVASGVNMMVYGGVRYGNFKSRANYNGGDVDYKSNAFGLGAGVEASYPISNNLSIIGNVGADYYFKSDIDVSSSNTTLVPASTSIKSDNSVYDRIKRPGATLKAGIGIKYGF